LLLEKCEAAVRDGQVHDIPYFQGGSGVAFVFVASAQSREKRAKLLPYPVEAAQVEFNAEVVVGIATGPLGKGRSYDVCYSGRFGSARSDTILSQKWQPV